MRILFPFVKGGSGSDVYFDTLSYVMNASGCQTNTRIYPQFFQFFPFLIRPRPDVRDYDVVHSNAECAFAFTSRSKPLVVTVHHLVFDPILKKHSSIGQKIYYKLLFHYTKRSLRLADSIIAVSENTKRETERIFQIDNVTVIYNGIDTETFRPSPSRGDPYPGKIKVLFVGNLTKRKGADLLPKIAEKLDDRFLILYTSGLRTNRRFMNEKIIPLGRLDPSQLIETYNLCDMVIVPSRLEGFGYAAAEAMACGKPVVATRGSSLPELIVDGQGGFLCEMDNVDDFVEKIGVLTEDPILRKQQGEFNRQRAVDRFSLQEMGNRYRDFYSSLLYSGGIETVYL